MTDTPTMIPSPFPKWTPPEPDTPRLTRAAADELGATIQSVATAQAQMDARLLQLIGDFDAGGGISHHHEIKSTAHWLSWACSMAIGTAREHVRVARSLRAMPRTRQLMSEGRLTYSKVRELTRIADLMDEEALCELALEMTASQLARTVRAYRAAPGHRIGQESRRALSWRETEDGMIRLSACIPAEEAALLRAALDVAMARAESDDLVQALVDVANGYLSADPTELADDHHLVVVHVSADQLAAPDSATEDVPAGTSFVDDAGPGRAPVEPATAARLACTGSLLGVIVDNHGDVLALGRRTRLATKAQRRALRVRDGGRCQFPGCHSTHHLDAHHIIPWQSGGRTDLSNMILLCRRHHVCCHEGGITIELTPHGPEFRHPDGSPVRAPAAWQAPDIAHQHLLRDLQHWFETQERQPERVFPRHGGAGYSLHECAAVLFNITTPLAKAA